MPESLIYLVRHGRPELPDREVRFLGRTDIPLSAEGRAQAEGLRDHLEDIRLDLVVHSGMKRALETASIIAGNRGIPFREIPEFREIAFGEWEMKSMHDVSRSDPDAFRRRGEDFARFRPPGGENFLDVSRRAWPAFLSLAGEFRGNILISAHAGVFRAILFAILRIPWQRLFSVKQDYCGVHVLSFMDGYFTVERFNWLPCLGGRDAP